MLFALYDEIISLFGHLPMKVGQMLTGQMLTGQMLTGQIMLTGQMLIKSRKLDKCPPRKNK